MTGGGTQPGTAPDGMQVDRDVPIEMDDGLVLRADVFRPARHVAVPVLLSYGPYGKGLPFQEGYPSAWERLSTQHPEVGRTSTGRYQNWEVADPEIWVPEGYACVRVDSRGSGRSPGYLDHFSPRETRDLHDCIEWAGRQPWSTGKVALSGISYYGINQWHVAGLQPEHLTAMVVWEGAADWYRDMTHHGGILSTFWDNWYDMQVRGVQHGVGERGPRNPETGALVAGPETLDDEELERNRCALGDEILAHPTDDGYHRARSAEWPKVVTPFLSAANWGGQGLHSRGNFEAFINAASRDKWLEVHGLEHWTTYYTDYGIELQKRFLAHFLQGADNGWDEHPRVLLQVRTVDGFVERSERDWPIPRTRWTPLYLDPHDRALRPEPVTDPGRIAFDATGDGVTFTSDPLDHRTEITGPVSSRLHVASSTVDADVFLVLRVFDPDGDEIVFQGAIDPHTPVAQGWLRASHRAVDPQRSTPWRPYHTHTTTEPLVPEQAYVLDVEIWPTSIVVPEGYRIALTVRGRDYEHPAAGTRLSNFKNTLRGSGPFLHDDPRDRPEDVYAGVTTIHAGGDRQAWVMVPVIPTPDDA